VHHVGCGKHFDVLLEEQLEAVEERRATVK
jgi:hypothetical protein